MRLLLGCLAVSAIACSSGGPPADRPTAPPPPSGVPPVGAPPTAPSGARVVDPGAVDAALIAKACAGPCAGPMARVELWRDGAGAIARLVYDGDLGRCSHPPRLYLDASGATTLTIPNHPVVAGSDEALGYQRDQAAELAGLTKDRVASCASP